MTDEQIIQALVAQGWKPNDVDHNECAAYRLGWEARGKRDEEVCRAITHYPRDSITHLHESHYTHQGNEQCALAIAREGTCQTLTEAPMPSKRDEWQAKYVLRMVERGIDSADAWECCLAGADDHDYDADPREIADEEMSYWTDDGDGP